MNKKEEKTQNEGIKPELTRVQVLAAYWDTHPATLGDPIMAPSPKSLKHAQEVLELAYQQLGITGFDKVGQLKERLGIQG